MRGDFFLKNLIAKQSTAVLMMSLVAWRLNDRLDSVGKMRADCHRTGVKGIVDTRKNSTTLQPLPRCTWADVVKGTTQAKAIRGQEMIKTQCE